VDYWPSLLLHAVFVALFWDSCFSQVLFDIITATSLPPEDIVEPGCEDDDYTTDRYGFADRIKYWAGGAIDDWTTNARASSPPRKRPCPEVIL
jgi:hypothetical protein